MTRRFELPDVGEGVREGEVLEWLVEAGERVVEGQPLVTVETDKAVVDLPSPVDGRVVERLVRVGEVVEVGAPLVTLEPTDGTKREGNEGPAASGFATPRTRRLARELGVELAGIDGSGAGGRVTAADVRAAAADDGDAAGLVIDVDERDGGGQAGDRTANQSADDGRRVLAVPAARRLARERGVDLSTIVPSEERDGLPVVTLDDVREADEERVVGDDGSFGTGGAAGERLPYRGTRRAVGEAMVRSTTTIPHATHHDDVDVTALDRVRERLRPAVEGDRLTYLPFVMKAVAAALRAHPIVNSTLDEDAGEIVLHERYDIGVATATDRGLLVPVVRDVDRKGIAALAEEIDGLVERARSDEITPEEMRDATFTVTNFGSVGGRYATPIVNHPEVAILGIGAAEPRPRVVEDEVLPRTTLPLSLSIDHRVVDGAVAAAFVNEVKRYLREPSYLLLE